MTTTDLPPPLRHADSDAELQACWPAMQQLRPHLAHADAFVASVRAMRADGYRLLAAWQGDTAVALGGYRLQRNLVYGRFLYVDDLVTLDRARGHGWGARLIATLQGIAAEAGCAQFVLDTGVANTGAQRFYLRQGLANHAIGFGRRITAQHTTE